MNRLAIRGVRHDQPSDEPGALRLEYFAIDIPQDLDGVSIMDVRCASQPADSGLDFDELLPSLAGTLLEANQQLALFVKGVGRDFYDEVDAITRFLHPRRRRYHLSTPLVWRQDDIGDLIFECASEELNFINDEWLVSPAVALEGYVGGKPIVDQLLAMWGNRSDETVDARAILRAVDWSFRLWQDYDGLSLFSTAARAEEIQKKLVSSTW